MIYHFKPYDRETDEIGLDRARYMDLLNAETKLGEIKETLNFYNNKPIYELDLVEFHRFRLELEEILEDDKND